MSFTKVDSNLLLLWAKGGTYVGEKKGRGGTGNKLIEEFFLQGDGEAWGRKRGREKTTKGSQGNGFRGVFLLEFWTDKKKFGDERKRGNTRRKKYFCSTLKKKPSFIERP